MARYIYGKLKTTGEIIGIEDVPSDLKERAAFSCVCPQCGIDLVARKGETKENHFAHKVTYSEGNVSCSAKNANETALHQMALDIILKELKKGEGTIKVPSVEFYLSEMETDDIPPDILSKLPKKLQYKQQTSLKYKKAAMEEWASGYLPGLILDTDAGKIIIDMYVTHTAQPRKLKKAEELNLPILEIDLSEAHEKSFGREALREIILDDTAQKHWLVRPENDAVTAWGALKYEKIAGLKNSKELERAKEEAKQKRDELFQPDAYRNAIFNLEGKEISFLAGFHFYELEKRVPFFINIPIKGEMVFKCDRRVWQGAIFDKFIYYRNPDKKDLSVEYGVISWVKKHQKLFEVDWSLLKGSQLLKEVIKTYLNYLANLGFLSDYSSRSGKYTICETRSVVPPNETYAALLIDAMRNTDPYNPEVDEAMFKCILKKLGEDIKSY